MNNTKEVNMEKFNNKTAIWGDQNEKYLRNVVLYTTTNEYAEESCKLFYNEELTDKVYASDLKDMFLKGIVLIRDMDSVECYRRPDFYNAEECVLITDGGNLNPFLDVEETE